MEKFVQAVQNFWNDEEGVTAIEYGLIASLIAIVIIIPLTNVGVALQGIFNQVVAAL